MLEQQRTQIYDTTDDTQTDYQAFSHIKKDLYQNKVFCWIEEGNTANVIKFYNTFPHLINELYTPNHWNPLMYAVRYGNLQLIKFLFEKGMKTQVQGIYNHVSIIHSAVYSGQLSILSYILNNISKNANPSNCQTSPLKISMKTGNPKMVQLLIAKGAYYTFGDVYNNLSPKQVTAQQSNKYITLDTNKEISNTLVVQDSTIKDCPIKETLRWARIRQAMYMKYYAVKMAEERSNAKNIANMNLEVKEEEMEEQIQEEQQKMEVEGQNNIIKQKEPQKKPVVNTTKILDERHKFYGLAQILLNDQYYDSVLKVLVGKGDSILIKNDPVQQKQAKQSNKEPGTSAQQPPKK